jgi:hypothetical protein
MQRLCRLVLLGIALGAIAVQGENPTLLNGNFEEQCSHWRHWGGRDTRTDFYGLKAFDGERFARVWDRSGWYQDFELAPGTQYGAQAKVAVSSQHPLLATAYGELKLEWRKIENGSDDLVAQEVVDFNTAGTRQVQIEENTWTAINIPPTAPPADATHGRVVLVSWYKSPDPNRCCLCFDNIILTAATPSEPVGGTP